LPEIGTGRSSSQISRHVEPDVVELSDNIIQVNRFKHLGRHTQRNDIDVLQAAVSQTNKAKQQLNLILAQKPLESDEVDYVREYNLASRPEGSTPRNSKGIQLSSITDFLKERGMLNQNQANSGLVYQGAKRFEKRTEKPYYNKEMLKMK